MEVETIEDLVGLTLACGAADIGGPLSDAEVALIKCATPASAQHARRARAAIRGGADPFGEALCSLRLPAARRALGAFYTDATIIDPMMSWVLEQSPARLVDPGCGSGRFSLAAVTQMPRVDLVAIDVDPVATMMTRAALASVGARNARVVNDSYLSVRLPEADGRSAFVGNPPYVRHHDVDARVKLLGVELARKAGHSLSKLAGLHALFYVATLAVHAKAGDVGSFVTSAEWLDVGYGSVIRSMFTSGLGGESLLVLSPKATPFQDAMTTAAITTFRVGAKRTEARFVCCDSLGDIASSHGTGHDVAYENLASASRWSPFLRASDAGAKGSTIGTTFRVSRGQVTGANHFFVMSAREAKERGIEQFCVPVIVGAEEIISSGGALHQTQYRKVALEVPKDVDLHQYPALARYIREGERGGVARGYIASRRRPWYALTYPRPPIVATYMARQAPIFARNPDELGVLNIAHGLYPRTALDGESLDRIVALLNEKRSSFVGCGRTYHGGLEKFEPAEMAALPLDLPA